MTPKQAAKARRALMADCTGSLAPKLNEIRAMLAQDISPRQIADNLAASGFQPTDLYSMAQSIRHIRRRERIQRLLAA